MQRPSGGMTTTTKEADAVCTDHYRNVSMVRDDDDCFDVNHYYGVQRAVREEAAKPASPTDEEKVGGGMGGDITLAELRTALEAAEAGVQQDPTASPSRCCDEAEW